ncbi:hypothetical protein HOY80DRAFT_982680 [Tuber brumale]|nr:hypothetical protein HOY80DRAFT_982680 [Tuber brumale]
MNSFRVLSLLHVYSSSLITAGITSATVVWQMKKLRSEIGRVEEKLESDSSRIGERFECIQEKLESVPNDVKDTKSMLLITGRHIMNALDGNKKPMREWLHTLEHSVQTGGEGCTSTKTS